MLTRKILSSTAALAMTASIALLAGCPTPGGTPTPSDSSAPSGEPGPTGSPGPSGSPGPTGSPVITATPTAPVATPTGTGGSATATPTQSSQPAGQTGSTSDIRERATFNGKVYDENGIVVDNAKVNAKSVDDGVSWVGEEQTTTNGAYVFRNAPVGARIEITVTKDNWTTRTRTEVLKSNLQGDPTANVFDFGGLGGNGQDATSSFYNLQDEPEIISLKINGQQAISSGGFPSEDDGSDGTNGRFGIANEPPGETGGADAAEELRTREDDDGDNLQVSMSGLDNDRLDIELIFSEGVDRESVQNNFQVISQNFDELEDESGEENNFEVDETLEGITFTWASDSRSVLIKTNKPMLTTTGNPEGTYMLNWTSPFEDEQNNQALNVDAGNVSPTGHFRYSPGTNNDFNVFSLEIDDEEPRLLSISAQDGSGANDIIRLTFSEALEVVNHTSLALALADPNDTDNPSADRQLAAYNTQNGDVSPDDCDLNDDGDCSDTDADDDGDDDADFDETLLHSTENEASVLGYFNDDDIDDTDNFQAVYMIARLPAASQVEEEADIKTTALAQNLFIDDEFVSCDPSRGGTGDNIGNESLLRFAAIDGNTVTLEFAQEAFQRNERIIVSVGSEIDTSYTDQSEGLSREPIEVDSETCEDGEPTFSNEITDPAGNDISDGNSTTSGSFEVNDALRVATAS